MSDVGESVDDLTNPDEIQNMVLYLGKMIVHEL